MARQARQKDMAQLREVPGFAKSLKEDLSHGDLKDYGTNSIVMIDWNLNDESKRDRIFKMSINGQTAYLDLEEFLMYSRLM